MKLEIKDVIKLIGFVGTVLCMWYDLKTDLEIVKVKISYIESRVDKLENSNEKRYAVKFPNLAVLPAETKIEDEYK